MHKSAWFRKRTVLDDNLAADDCFSKSENLLRDYVLRLKPNYRAVIFLFYYEGYSTAEIADILKMSDTAVTTRLSRARNQLRTELINNKEELIYEYVH
jgi:RNA polymerase sigma-70 factor (ECF subfamily)